MQDVSIHRGQEYLSAAFRLSPIAFAFSDVATGRLLDVNDAFTRLFGYTRDELIGRTTLDLGFWRDTVQREHMISSARRSSEYIGPEVRLHRKDGSFIYTRISSKIIPDTAGSQFFTIYEDLTAVKKQEARFTALIQKASDLITVHDATGRCLYNTPSVDVGLGYPSGFFIGKNAFDFVHPHDRDLASRVFSSVLHDEAPNFPQEYRFRKADGSWICLEAVGSNLLDDPNIGGIVITSRDISARKAAEEALRESEEKFRALAEKSIVGIYLIQDGLFRYVNGMFADIFEYRVEEMIDKITVEEVIHPENWPLVQENLRKRLEGEIKSLHYEIRVCTKSNKIKNVEIYSSQTLYRAKPAVIGTVLDVTERKRALEDLRRLSIAIEQAAEDIIITDPEGTIQYVNPAFETITGYTRQEAIGQTPRLLKSGIHDDAFYKQLWNTIKGGNLWTGRITNRRKDGVLIQEDAIISPLMDSFNEISGYVALKRDVTQIVWLEGQYRQAQKMEAIGTLAGGIAHDFNNILTAILGFTDIALMDPTLSDRLRNHLGQVYKAGERARDLVQQILTFSRQSDEKPRPIRVSPIVKEALKLLRASLPSTISIHQDIQTEPDTVLADATQIHQILMNLCTNASQAMPNGKGDLTVTLTTAAVNPMDELVLHHHVSPGTFLHLSVSDTGEGIAPEIMNRIFDPFFTTKKIGEGTGMGLSVVYGIVKSYRGTVTVESEPRKGSVFHVYIPLLAEERPETSSGKTMPIVGGTERILFVDDEENLVELGKEILAGLGYSVEGKTSSVEVLEIFRTRSRDFDLVITDMTMPNMTGSELAQGLLYIRPDLPVILCTGFSETITPEAAKRIGIKEFIMKPLIKQQLAAAIRRVLDAGKS